MDEEQLFKIIYSLLDDALFVQAPTGCCNLSFLRLLPGALDTAIPTLPCMSNCAVLWEAGEIDRCTKRPKISSLFFPVMCAFMLSANANILPLILTEICIDQLSQCFYGKRGQYSITLI